ncbi:MAG: allophanate hydrolase, partial [Noviherbaspirillum sp.]|nr:allophanate hydrolase [Noviherbaspirillum sp.]
MENNDIIAEHGLSTSAALHGQYAAGALLPSDCIAGVLQRITKVDRPEIWISRVDGEQLLRQARALDAMLHEEGAAILARMPLFGIPFAVKDNIDVAGMPTTAACPEFAYVPERSATVVGKLLAAGALLVGKTNLDQFATGLVGVRSPYGAVRNAVDPAYVSGGSSSGSAVAVALGLCVFSLGTDTAGSGRVPAGLNGIVGLKPTRGLFSTRGVFPACRTLDCVSVFARNVADAWRVAQVAAGFDAEDSYSRKVAMLGVRRRGFRIAVPSELEFFGDTQAEQAFTAAIAALKARPDCEVGAIDYTPFNEAAQLLYQGPWVAERLAAAGSFFDEKREAMHPVVAGIIGQGANYSAADAFNGQYRLAALRRQAEQELRGFDFLVVPTTPTMPRIADVEREPVKLNSQLGYYTN